MSKDYSYTKYVNNEFIQNYSIEIQHHYPRFDTEEFSNQVEPQIENLNFTGRMRLISTVTHELLDLNYPRSIEILLKTLGSELETETGTFNLGYKYWPISCFIEDYGLNYFEESINAIYELTKRFTAEYAVRPFLIKYPQQMKSILERWVDDPNSHVRRLVSEGTRPTIPWGKKIPQFIEDPTYAVPLLTKLRNDQSRYVQKSVANHLNAISKIQPILVTNLVRSWVNESKNVNWIIKQALRTLKKNDDSEAKLILQKLS